MSVGILLITHPLIGKVLLDTALKIIAATPLAIASLDVEMDSDKNIKRQQAEEHIEKLDQGDGILILTDLFGATPSNIACELYKRNEAEVISGLNLPMLMRILNYPNSSLNQLCEIAINSAVKNTLQYKGQS